jgi:hypothetical protein
MHHVLLVAVQSHTLGIYASTWSFFEEMCNEAARILTDGSGGLLIPGIPLNPAHVMAASAVPSSLVGAAKSFSSYCGCCGGTGTA